MSRSSTSAATNGCRPGTLCSARHFLHPMLLPELGEECRVAAERTQLLVTTHSPFFLDTCRASEVRVLYRDRDGYTRAQTASEINGVEAFIDHGASLGRLWMEGHFGIGNPLRNQGAPEVVRGG